MSVFTFAGCTESESDCVALLCSMDYESARFRNLAARAERAGVFDSITGPKTLGNIAVALVRFQLAEMESNQ